ncbi:hypothetical protein D3C78_1809960 [compost metagenome]
MPQHHYQWGAQHRHRVFKAGQSIGGDEVASNAHGEQIAATGIERVLRGNA